MCVFFFLCLLGGRIRGGGCFVFSGFLKMTLTLFIKLFSSRNALHQRRSLVARLPGEKRTPNDNADLFLEDPGSMLAQYKSTSRRPHS